MALIICPECGHQVSTTAASCPKCGYTPSAAYSQGYPQAPGYALPAAHGPKKSKSNGVLIAQAAGVLLVFAVLFAVAKASTKRVLTCWSFQWRGSTQRSSSDCSRMLRVMMFSRRALGVAVLLVVASACGKRGPAPPPHPNQYQQRTPPPQAVQLAPVPPPVPQPPMVHVHFTGVLIGPMKANGDNWDPGGPGSSSMRQMNESLDGVLALAAPDLVVAKKATGLLTAAVMDNKSKPDAFGSATLWVSGVERRAKLPESKNTFAPTWAAMWRNVVLDESVRLQVKLFDEDTGVIIRSEKDPMGTFLIGHEALLKALLSQKNYPVRVDDQTTKRILFAYVTVIPTS